LFPNDSRRVGVLRVEYLRREAIVMPEDHRTTLEREFSRSGWLTPWDRFGVEFGAVVCVKNRSLLHFEFRNDSHYAIVGSQDMSATVAPTLYMVTTEVRNTHTLTAFDPSLLDAVEAWRTPVGGIMRHRCSFVKTFFSRPPFDRYDDHGLYEFANLRDEPLSQFGAALPRLTTANRRNRTVPSNSDVNALLSRALTSTTVATFRDAFTCSSDEACC
jgi:hypothetical protein